MSDSPDAIVVASDLSAAFRRFDGFAHLLALLPPGMTLTALRPPQVVAVFLIEPGAAGDALNGSAFPAYLDARTPVLVHARRARDLRPFLRRADSFRRRGYSLEVIR